jgi:hypothetical protein
MRPSLARSSGPAASSHMLPSMDCITTTSESEFSVHTPVPPAGNNARAAVPEGPSESLTVSGLRLVTPRSESLGSFP